MNVLDAAVQDRKARTPPINRVLPEDTQQVCIDLPGEAIRCVVYKPKLEIMLRKHRDVIFELQLFRGMTYTVEADQSDFYNARDKKLCEVKKKHKTTFNDGERMHLWVSREFKGNLILKANGKVMGKYQPNLLDLIRYDADPVTKPAPLVVLMKNEPSSQTVTASALKPTQPIDTGAGTTLVVPSFDPLFFSKSKPANERDQTMHVIEVRPDSTMPEQVASFFKQGGEQTALDSNGILTRNWLWIQIVGGAGYFSENQPWIKELWKEKFYLQRVKHKAGEKVYVVFKGNPALRTFLSGTRYSATHSKVLAITAGAGTAVGLRHAAWDGAKGAMKRGGALTVIFATVINVAEWLADYEQRDLVTGQPKKDFFDLVFKIGVDVAKAVVSAVIGAVVMGLVVMGVTALGMALTGAVIVVGTISVAVLIGVGLDWLDKKSSAAEKLNKSIRDSAGYLEGRLPKDYLGYPRSLNDDFNIRAGA